MDNPKFWTVIKTFNFDALNKVTHNSEGIAFVQAETVIDNENEKNEVELLDRIPGRHPTYGNGILKSKLDFIISGFPFVEACIKGITDNIWLYTVALICGLFREIAELYIVNFNANDMSLFLQLMKTAVHSTLELIQELAVHIKL